MITIGFVAKDNHEPTWLFPVRDVISRNKALEQGAQILLKLFILGPSHVYGRRRRVSHRIAVGHKRSS
jgi:hypothetical protein